MMYASIVYLLFWTRPRSHRKLVPTASSEADQACLFPDVCQAVQDMMSPVQILRFLHTLIETDNPPYLYHHLESNCQRRSLRSFASLKSTSLRQGGRTRSAWRFMTQEHRGSMLPICGLVESLTKVGQQCPLAQEVRFEGPPVPMLRLVARRSLRKSGSQRQVEGNWFTPSHKATGPLARNLIPAVIPRAVPSPPLPPVSLLHLE